MSAKRSSSSDSQSNIKRQCESPLDDLANQMVELHELSERVQKTVSELKAASSSSGNSTAGPAEDTILFFFRMSDTEDSGIVSVRRKEALFPEDFDEIYGSVANVEASSTDEDSRFVGRLIASLKAYYPNQEENVLGIKYNRRRVVLEDIETVDEYEFSVPIRMYERGMLARGANVWLCVVAFNL